MFAIKPIPAENPANVTRNIVFQEVLDGVRQAVEVSVTPTAVSQEVEDITEWNDYEAIEVEMENMQERSYWVPMVRPIWLLAD